MSPKLLLLILLIAVVASFVLYRSFGKSDNRTVEELVAALSHPDGFARGEAVEELMRRRDPRAVPLLTDLLLNGSQQEPSRKQAMQRQPTRWSAL